jgi:glycerophosphoryl diester phosphodiesterase
MSLFLRKKSFAFFCICFLSFAFCVQSQTVHLPHTKHKLVIIAHRGNHVAVPENTIASYQEAIKCGADYVEVDLRTTKDGHLVVMHDASVDRTTNGKGKVSELKFEEIENLHVFNNNKKTHRIPEFHEVLKACKGKIHIYLDFKDADVAETWKQITAAGMEKEVIVYLNKEVQYGQWKTIAPHVPLMTSAPDHAKTKEQLAHFLSTVQVQILDNVKDPALLEVLKEKGVQVWLDVQSRTEGPESWVKALENNIQGLQTDHPADLIAYLKEHNKR